MASDQLTEIVRNRFINEEGVLYIGYPVLATADGREAIDALWISRERGLIAIQMIEGRDTGDFAEAQDEIASLLEAKLLPHKSLKNGRYLASPPVALTFAPLSKHVVGPKGHVVANIDTLVDAISEISWATPELYETSLSVIQSISTIRKNLSPRKITNVNSHGNALKTLEDSIANLDSRQSRAVIETVDGVQRIRGLAGSGKTIILALKAAYLHSQNPDWKIAVTFNTRSLKHQFINLIDTFVRDQTGSRPNDNLQVINAWGARGGALRTGVYYQFCVENGVEYLDFQAARGKFGFERAFGGAVESALRAVENPKKIFDAILVDEAQDFDPAFLRLCYSSLDAKRRLVYAYDELQSLTDSSLPPVEEIFGLREDGTPEVAFQLAADGSSSHDIILEKCYRNSRPVLATAHSLGFGVYRDPDPKIGTGLVQMFDRAELWREVGYDVIAGELSDGNHVTLSRTPRSSPEFLEDPAVIEPLLQTFQFQSRQEQAQWLATQIEKNLRDDDLRPEDIIVINPNPLSTNKEVGPIRKILFERGINSHLAGVDTDSDVFFRPEEGSVAFTGIFRAKGNEAGMVYIMNAQDCYGSLLGTGRVRNQLFTAITRSKAWVKITGIGTNMALLTDEIDRIRAADYRLNFIYPDEATRKKLRVVNRDLTIDEQKAIRRAKQSIADLASDLTTGRLQLEDLPAEQLAALRKILGQHE
ncbi:DEAD/DEAH box helicase [Paracoccus yeei]|uniref:DEAD/DEAH box helicase n=1 Tax=Paracoccus yeei TaxID=147645 RepID=UPI001C8EB0D6|nr:ATP-binding domain-containing protein [Paracoccus yeei]